VPTYRPLAPLLTASSLTVTRFLIALGFVIIPAFPTAAFAAPTSLVPNSVIWQTSLILTYPIPASPMPVSLAWVFPDSLSPLQASPTAEFPTTIPASPVPLPRLWTLT
jgi:hypothetical protein